MVDDNDRILAHLEDLRTEPPGAEESYWERAGTLGCNKCMNCRYCSIDWECTNNQSASWGDEVDPDGGCDKFDD